MAGSARVGLWGLLAVVVTGVLVADFLDRGSAVGRANGGSVAIVAVDTGEDFSRSGLDVGHDDVLGLAVTLAVAARSGKWVSCTSFVIESEDVLLTCRACQSRRR